MIADGIGFCRTCKEKVHIKENKQSFMKVWEKDSVLGLGEVRKGFIQVIFKVG